MSDHQPELWDQLSIDTPELVAIELHVAGIGSRLLAILLDYLIQGAAVFLVLLILLLLSLGPGQAGRAESAAALGKWVIAIILFIPFLLHWGYFTLFEAFWHGQTPGKRVVRLRVIQQTGRPIGLFAAMIRNLIRAIDALPALYLVGAIAVFFSRRQQRLGDLVAGTLVIHAPQADTPILPASNNRTFTAAAFPGVVAPPAPQPSLFAADALGRLNEADLQVIESFLARRLDLPLPVRADLAKRLVGRATARTQTERPPEVSDETLLENLATSLRQIISMN
jgi:uncharacterized RDD family membrane protein YckC